MAIAHVLRFLFVAAGVAATAAPAQAEVFRCPGGIIQDTPCRVVAPPPPEPSRPACTLPPELLRRAAREETQFLRRYPDANAHRRVQHGELADVANHLRSANTRLTELKGDYRRIAGELEFYPAGALPPKLLASVNANIGQFGALKQIYDNLKQDVDRIVGRCRCEQATFGKMWSGAAPGSSACDRPACAQPL